MLLDFDRRTEAGAGEGAGGHHDVLNLDVLIDALAPESYGVDG